MRPSTSQDGRQLPRVVIIGAGFAGLNAARKLARKPVEVFVVDRNNYHLFQPLLYQVATSGLEPDEVVHPVRDIFRKHENIHFLLGEVQDVDLAGRTLLMTEGPPVPYDYLVVAAGAASNYFGIEGADVYAKPMKTIPDALRLRNYILRQFERCEREPGKAEKGALNFVIVGGGPTGIELAGQLVELFRRVMRKDYRRVDTAQARVILLEMQPELLAGFHDKLRAYARRVLEKWGVEVRTEAVVAKVAPDAVYLKSGEVIPTKTLIWAAGIRANPLGEKLGTPLRGGGRIAVEADLSLPGHPEVLVIGDMSGRGEEGGGPLYPQLATVAIQQGYHAARQVLRMVEGKPTEPFRYSDPGIMATIGRNAGVVQLAGGIRMKGFFAWLMWVFVHIYKLVAFRDRFDVFLKWMYNYLTYDLHARLILDAVPESPPQNRDDIPSTGSNDGRAVSHPEKAFAK
jgi:NADH:ubiquinone reductase (H+-translocating)